MAKRQIKQKDIIHCDWRLSNINRYIIDLGKTGSGQFRLVRSENLSPLFHVASQDRIRCWWWLEKKKKKKGMAKSWRQQSKRDKGLDESHVRSTEWRTGCSSCSSKIRSCLTYTHRRGIKTAGDKRCVIDDDDYIQECSSCQVHSYRLINCSWC